ncbi:MAG: hypothetical protein ACC644_05835 [Candidatus Hydrothermarchaeales archaeon]
MERADDIRERAAEATEELNIQRDTHQLALAQIGADWQIISKPFDDRLAKIEKEISDKKAEIASIMTAEEKKTVDLESATVKLRVTKSVQILDKVGLVAELSKIKDGVEKGVKAFALPHIRKLMEVGVVDEGLAMFSENRGISITPKEPTAVELSEAEPPVI